MATFGTTSPVLKKATGTTQGTPAAGGAAPNVNAATPPPVGEGRGPVAPKTCNELCKEAGYPKGGRLRPGDKGCPDGFFAEDFDASGGRTKTCCCEGNSGPNPNAPADCLEGYSISGNAMAGCKPGWRKKDYGDLGFWCCKDEAPGESPCKKGIKASTGEILNGKGKKVEEPSDCEIGTVALKDNSGSWWCCEAGVPVSCGEGGYRVEPNGTCNEGFQKKTIDGKTYCCPSDCDPNAKKGEKGSCPSGYRCNPETKKCEFAEGVKECFPDHSEVPAGGEYGVANEGDKYCEKTYGEGYICLGGKCQKAGECPEGKGMDYTGCPCGKTYTTMSGSCVPGYVFVKREGTGWEGYKEGAKGRCECLKYCHDLGCDDNCMNCSGGNLAFGWSPEVQALLKRLMERANYFLDYPSGYTPEQRNAIVNQALRMIKGKERGNIEAIRGLFARQGLAGSGLQMGREAEARRESRESVADTAARIAIEEENKIFQELAGSTGLTQNIMSLLMGAEQIPEAINAARRAEANPANAAVLQLLATLMGSSQQGLGTILQAIMNYAGSPTSSGSSGSNWGDIASYLSYILS